MRIIPHSTTDRFGRTWHVRFISMPNTLSRLVDIWYEKDKKYFLAKPIKLEFEEIDPQRMVEFNTIELEWGTSDALIQALANGLEEVAVTADTAQKVNGQLEMMRNHLQDMRTIVFGTLKLTQEEQGDG